MEATNDVVQSAEISTYWNRLTPLLPGLWASLAVSIAAVCTGWGEERVFGRPIIEPLVVAILFGMLVRAVRWTGARQEPGVRFVAKDVLEVAVCLLGATMDVPRLFVSGPALAIGIVIVVAVALSAGYLIGRVVGLSPKLAVLVACGNAICGNSAIAAVAPVIGADREDVAASIALTAVLGVIAVLGLPLLMPLLGYTNYQYGVLAGLTVYAVPQVLAAAFAVSVLSGQVATVVKLARVLMLGPVVLFFSLRGDASSDGRVVRRGALVPWFVAGFVVLATLRSLGVVPNAAANASKLVASWLTIASMAALGLSSDLRSVRRVGARVVIAVGGSLSVLLLLAVSLIRVLRIH
ncbi:MAG TPA: putative sulfate exporter family transporter [Gemmatimonadaceae bacterium]|nr:putative sulfate exporter family transporter [Gemmatimonadaceae bacterium]